MTITKQERRNRELYTDSSNSYLPSLQAPPKAESPKATRWYIWYMEYMRYEWYMRYRGSQSISASFSTLSTMLPSLVPSPPLSPEAGLATA